MTKKTQTQIIADMSTDLETLSPQIRIDSEKGAFYWLSTRAVAKPIADLSAEVERLQLLVSLQFPVAATQDEKQGAVRSFSLPVSRGQFATGTVLFATGRRPVGTDVFTVAEGDVVSTARTNGVSFEVVETRSLTAGNADAFFNPTTRRYELPVRVRALTAGPNSRIASQTVREIRSGASDFEAVTNVAKFRGGAAAGTVDTTFVSLRQKLVGLDTHSRAGLLSAILAVDPDLIAAAALTYSSQYPNAFFRNANGPGIDAWILNTSDPTTATDTFLATEGQTAFLPSKKPVTAITAASINGVSVAATLDRDTSLSVGNSLREVSRVILGTPASAGDYVDISYEYDSVLSKVYAAVSGLVGTDDNVGALFGADLLVRYAKTAPMVVSVSGTALARFTPERVAADVDAVVVDYIENGDGDSPLLGGVRSPEALRSLIRTTVPGVDRLAIDRFAAKTSLATVESVDIPSYARATFEVAADRVLRFR